MPSTRSQTPRRTIVPGAAYLASAYEVVDLTNVGGIRASAADFLPGRLGEVSAIYRLRMFTEECLLAIRNSTHRGTAIHVDGLSGDVARFLGGQENNQVADVFGRLLSLQRGIGLYPSVE